MAGQFCAAADLQEAKLESKALCGLVLCGYRWDLQVEYHKATMVGAHAAPLLVNLGQLVVSETAAQSTRGYRLKQLYCSPACSAACMGPLGQQ